MAEIYYLKMKWNTTQKKIQLFFAQKPVYNA